MNLIVKRLKSLIGRLCPCFDRQCSHLVDAQQLEIERLQQIIKEISGE